MLPRRRFTSPAHGAHAVNAARPARASSKVRLMRMVAVVLAGGSGLRFGADVPKQLLRLGGRTLIEHCVAAFDEAPGIDEVLVVMPPGRIEEAAKLLDGGGYGKLTAIVEGGT